MEGAIGMVSWAGYALPRYLYSDAAVIATNHAGLSGASGQRQNCRPYLALQQIMHYMIHNFTVEPIGLKKEEAQSLSDTVIYKVRPILYWE